MELVLKFVDIFLHLDRYLGEVIQQFSSWTYALLFLIIFCETGLVVTPFLPGDSLLFVAGTFAALGSLDIALLLLVLAVAAILGDTVNYWIGRKAGPAIFHRDDVRFLNKKHLMKTHEFYERHGGKTIIIARFVPIIRTFAPFVAGVGDMSYPRFIAYNIIGALMWVFTCSGAGYFFGNIPVVKKNFSLVIMAIVIISVLPAVVEILRERARMKARQAAAQPTA